MSHVKAYAGYLIVVGVALLLARRYPCGPDSTRGRWLVLLAAAAGASIVTWAIDTPWFGDYESAYYPAGRLIFDSPQELYGSQCAFGFVNLPLLAIPFAPFSWFDYGVAVALFTLVGLAAIVVTARRLTAWSAGTRASAGRIVALVVVNGPLWYSVREGNSTHIVLLLMVVALIALRDRADVLAGALLGLAAAIKLPLVLLLGYFAARFRFRAAFGFGAALVGIVLTSVALHGWPLHELWMEQCIVPYAGKPVAAFNVQSLTGFLARLYGGDTYEWTPRVIGGSFQLVQRALTAGLALIVALALLRSKAPRDDTDLVLEFSAVLTLLLIISPLSWTHYYLLLLIPMVLLASGDVSVPTRGWGPLAIGAVLACSLPLRGLDTDSGLVRQVYDRWFASHHLYGGLLLLGLLLWARLHRARAARVS